MARVLVGLQGNPSRCTSSSFLVVLEVYAQQGVFASLRAVAAEA
jgi:hypothetical protein